MARTKNICPNKGTSIYKITLCVSVSPSLPPSICSLASKSPLFAPKNTKDPVSLFIPQTKKRAWMLLRDLSECWCEDKLFDTYAKYLPKLWPAQNIEGFSFISGSMQRSKAGRTIWRKNKLSSFLRQILRFLPLGNIRRFIRLGAKGVPKPFPHLGGHRTAAN